MKSSPKKLSVSRLAIRWKHDIGNGVTKRKTSPSVNPITYTKTPPENDPNVGLSKKDLGRTPESIKQENIFEQSTQAKNIDDPGLIFKRAWAEIELKKGIDNMKFPKEIIFLMGAPGSGKGTNTPFILRERGMTADPIVMSDLLCSPEDEELKKKARLVSDYEVVVLLLEKLLEPQFKNGCVVDGFPRTPAQVSIVKLLYDSMMDLRRKYSKTPLASEFPRPVFRVTVLFVDEDLSVQRQLERGRRVKLHNEKVRQTGFGKPIPERPTDLDVKSARDRYNIFADNYDTLKTLREYFTFNIIPATASIDEVEQAIVKEFAYQSRLELDSRTFDAIQVLPTAQEVILHSRQKMVERLDSYSQNEKALFDEVVHTLEQEFFKTITLHSLGGNCIVRSKNKIFQNNSAIAIAVDILAERGFQAICDVIDFERPYKINPDTYEVLTETEKRFVFHIRFKRPVIRHDSTNK